MVDTVGREVDTLKPGDRVMAMLGWGGMAEYVVTQARSCFVIPMPCRWTKRRLS